MQNKIGPLVACLAALGTTLPAAGPDPQWDMPRTTNEAFLPRLGAVKLDGDLGEWGAAAAVPLRFASYIARITPGHTWNGPADCSMEAFCGWNEDGLCIGGFVADDDVRNDRPPENSYEQDCLELYIDGRIGAAFMKPPYTKGACHLFVRPPADARGAELAFNKMYGLIEGVRLAGKPAAGGWTFELVVPWSAFSGFAAATGACVGLQFGLDDYDARDAGAIQPLMMSWQAATSLFMSPQKMVKWTLADAFPYGATAPLGMEAGIDLPAEITEGDTVKGALQLGRTLSSRAASGFFTIKDWTGAVAATGPITLAGLAAPWQDSAGGAIEWRLGSATDGVCTVEATFADAKGAPLGVARRHVLVVRGVVSAAHSAVADAIARIDKANVAALAKTDPFKASAWLGAAACVEKLKWLTELRRRQLVPAIARELAARLSVLETGALPKDCAYPFTLLALTAHPEAQVVVEYGVDRESTQPRSSVTFYSGGFPLASAWIQDFPNAEEAGKAFDAQPGGWWCSPLREEFRLAGLPARSSRLLFAAVPFDLARFDPTNQVLVCSFGRGFVVVLDAGSLDAAQADAATVAASAPRSVRKLIQRWANKTGKPVVADFQEAATNAWFVLGGLPAGEKELRKLREVKQVARAVQGEFPTWTTVLEGSRIITVGAPSREACEPVVRLIAAGKPPTAYDADALRLAVLKSVSKPAVTHAPVTNMNLYCGDVHVHSGYSDGSSTPVGMALQAMHCGMDFMVQTDHNTVDGAMVAAKLFQACGIAFPLIVGQEVTTSWAHMNAYPLREYIRADLPPYETIRAAHVQGAVIQWNHPGVFDQNWYLAHGEDAMRGTGLDAWEHAMPQYAQWKKEGRLPPMVGSTDTHGGVFGDGERTVILAPGPAGEDVAEAVRRGAVMLADGGEPGLFLGSDEMVARGIAALADGGKLAEQRAARLRTALENADIPALLRKSPAGIVKPADVAP